MKTIKDIDLNEKKVLIRCDFNVPIKDGKIVDDTRIEGALPTIKYAIEHNAKVILLSHLGRVKGQEDLEKNDLSPVAECLSKKLEKFQKILCFLYFYIFYHIKGPSAMRWPSIVQLFSSV